MTDPRFLLAIPVFNEEKYVRGVLALSRAYVEDILVVDDGSTDRTPLLLGQEPNLHVIRHSVNRGYGQSLIDAFGFAAREGFDWLITMDCDDQHEPAFIPKFMAAARRGQADLISGTRYQETFSADNDAPSDRRLINRRITEMLNYRLGLNLTDAFCGFKAYRVDSLRCLRLSEPGYAMPLQFWVQVARQKWRISELPVPRIYNDLSRQFGGSLDDPAQRFDHYVSVFEAEMATCRGYERKPCGGASVEVA